MSIRPVLPLIFAVAIGACRSGPAGPTIALTYPAWGVRYTMAAESLWARGPDRGMHPALLLDSAARKESTEGMVAWAQRVVERRDVVAAVGPSGSRVALATAPIYGAGGVPQVVPMATSARLHEAGPWTFTLAPDDSEEGAFLARYVVGSARARRVILFYENDEFGQGLREVLRGAFRAADVRVLAEIPVFSDSDFGSLFEAALQAGRPDAIVLAARQNPTGRVAKLAAQRLPGVPVIASDGALVLPELIDLAGDGLPNIRAVSFWLPDTTDPRQRAFIEAYRRANGVPPGAEAAMVQDAISLVEAAIRAAGPDRSAIRDWLASLGRDRPPFQGLTGPIGFGPKRTFVLRMVRVERDGRIVPEPVQ